MTPEDIEQMKADREAGADRWPGVVTTVYLGDGRAEMVILLGPVIPEPEKTIPIVRRVFRVPALEAEVLQWRALAEEFCRRAENHEIRSKRTYSKMKAILNGSPS